MASTSSLLLLSAALAFSSILPTATFASGNQVLPVLLGEEAASLEQDLNQDEVVDAADVVTGLEGGTATELTIMLPGDVPLILVEIPAGSFIMGSPSTERNRSSNEGPMTQVTLSSSFYMGKYPVTQNQWIALIEENPSLLLGDDHPVNRIGWEDAQTYITALNEFLATTEHNITVRLPREAEWEYAARAGTITRFSFGDSLIGESDGDNCEMDGLRDLHMWFCGNNSGSIGEEGYGTKPVGQKLPNAFGLHDMHGQVWEWCADYYGTFLPGGEVTDPTGPAEGSLRVTRGGTWSSDAMDCRSARRAGVNPSSSTFTRGFRLAAD
ncbi:MAG: formylglycine-generating enzyme family protein [Candidatus Sumerlaeia bacterium]|nr:formylglycine-generating enzyme family protein [Candidatus Sumerlaeia bacterium]